MDMSTSTQTSMSMDTPTISSTAPMTSSSSSMGGMGMGMGNGCKISMLWNWNVIDTCFISSSWHVRSKAMFAGSCIGVILLVVLLEFLRRAAKEYDRFIVMEHSKNLVSNTNISSSASSSNGAATNKQPETTERTASGIAGDASAKFRPSILQQAIRALLHTCAFAVAYFVMLLAMYYNGYFIICIFIGAYIGYFVFGWESFSVSKRGEDRRQEDATVCCG